MKPKTISDAEKDLREEGILRTIIGSVGLNSVIAGELNDQALDLAEKETLKLFRLKFQQLLETMPELNIKSYTVADMEKTMDYQKIILPDWKKEVLK